MELFFISNIMNEKLLYDFVLSRKFLSNLCYTEKDTDVKHAQCLGR